MISIINMGKSIAYMFDSHKGVFLSLCETFLLVGVHLSKTDLPSSTHLLSLLFGVFE